MERFVLSKAEPSSPRILFTLSQTCSIDFQTNKKKMQLSALFLTFLLSFVTALDSSQLLQHTARTSGNIIKLTNANFQKVISGPRDSHLFVMLTATNPSVGCVTCLDMQPAYNKLADSWFAKHADGKNVFFAEADFIDGQREVFKAFQVNNVPKLYYYPPTDKSEPVTSGTDVPIAQDPREFTKSIHAMIEAISGLKFKIIEPIQWGNMIITISTIALLAFSAVKFRSYYAPLLTSPSLWGAIVVFFIIVFNSGYMFNSIRGVPYVKSNADGTGVDYFTAGQQQQLGAETQIISFIYAILSFTVVSLITKTKTITHPKVQIVVVSILILVIFVVFSAYLNIFAFKSQGYPYTLLDVVKF